MSCMWKFAVVVKGTLLLLCFLWLGCTDDIPDPQPPIPVKFIGSEPPAGSTIQLTDQITFRFDGLVSEVTVNGKPAQVSGTQATFQGDVADGELLIKWKWVQGTGQQVLNFVVRTPEQILFREDFSDVKEIQKTQFPCIPDENDEWVECYNQKAEGEYKIGVLAVNLLSGASGRALQFEYKKAENEVGNEGSAGAVREADIDVSQLSSLFLSAEVKVIEQSLEGGGPDGRTYPVHIVISYEDTDRQLRFWQHGFYYLGNAEPVVATKTDKDEWSSYRSENLMDLARKPLKITQIQLKGNGGNFKGKITNVQLEGK
jgi:hypothetical protein